MSIETISMIGLGISCMFFYYHASKVNKKKLSFDNFMLCEKGITKSQFSSTFSASSFSFGMTVPFLLVNSKAFAIYVLVSPITFILGNLFFTYMVKGSNIDLGKCRTLSDMCYLIYPNKNIARLITMMTVTSYIMLLFLELYASTAIVTIFFGEYLIYKAVAFFGIGCFALILVKKGGYETLLRTDLQQIIMMLMATTAIFLFGVFCPVVNGSDLGNILLNTTQYTEDTLSMVLFMVWLSFINMTYPFTQLVNIQRLSATKSKKTCWEGALQGSWKLLALFLLTTFGFLLMHAKGYQIGSINDFLAIVKNSGLFGSVIFVCLMVGFGSMVLSSTDNIILAISYSLCDSNTFKNSVSAITEKHLRKAMSIFTIILLVILTAIFWLQYAGLQDYLMPLIYTTCSQLAILAPLSIYAVARLRKNKSLLKIEANKTRSLVLFNSILIAWVVLFIAAYMSKIGGQFYSLISLPVGTILVLAGLLFVTKYKKQFLSKYISGVFLMLKRVKL